MVNSLNIQTFSNSSVKSILLAGYLMCSIDININYLKQEHKTVFSFPLDHQSVWGTYKPLAVNCPPRLKKFQVTSPSQILLKMREYRNTQSQLMTNETVSLLTFVSRSIPTIQHFFPISLPELNWRWEIYGRKRPIWDLTDQVCELSRSELRIIKS